MFRSVVRQRDQGSRPDPAMVAVGTAAIYIPLSFARVPDLKLFLFPWLDHIRAAGPIGAFAHPFSNYAPPYLYLLSTTSLLGLSDLVTIKLLAIIGALWLAWCVGYLVAELGSDRLHGAERVLLLPSVIINAAVLGQCDAFWTGSCILALAAALRAQPYRAAAWTGVAFAFKAQAAFLAPFFVGSLVRRRAWPAFLLPLIIYLLAITPAAAAGWPLPDLLTIYLRQAGIAFVGDAPNLWAIPTAAGLGDARIFSVGYVLGAAAAVGAAWVAWRSSNPLRAALASALIVPFVLPKMLERFFFPADVVSLAIAVGVGGRRNITVAVLIQLGSFLSLVGYIHSWPWLNAAGSLPMAAALTMTLAAELHLRSARESDTASDCSP